MFTIDPGFIDKLAAAALGDTGLLRSAVKQKLRSLSKEMLNDLTGGNVQAVIRIGRQARRGVRRPFELARAGWLSGDEETEQTIYQQLIETVEKGGKREVRRGVRRAQTQPGWRRSRQYWLGEGWRHDWRSQPRDWHGRWIPGRLSRPYVSKTTRRLLGQRRRQARAAFRGIVSSWGQAGG